MTPTTLYFYPAWRHKARPWDYMRRCLPKGRLHLGNGWMRSATPIVFGSPGEREDWVVAKKSSWPDYDLTLGPCDE